MYARTHTRQVSVVVSDWWLADWADCSSQNLTALEETNRTTRQLCTLNLDQRVGVYGGSVLAVILLNLTRTIAFFFVCVNGSRVLHNRMFASILRVPVLFFDTNPIGRVLNRFSKDVGFLDDLLPFQFCEYMLVSLTLLLTLSLSLTYILHTSLSAQLLLRFLAIIITACVSNPWVLIPAAVIMTCLVLLRSYYLKTSRDIKRLEAVGRSPPHHCHITHSPVSLCTHSPVSLCTHLTHLTCLTLHTARSPLYSHISTTLQGLPTIRSFKQEPAALRYLYQ